jgi:hypothetical protein
VVKGGRLLRRIGPARAKAIQQALAAGDRRTARTLAKGHR